ncbi:MAG TPA: pentapeptide repeat-containing protein [Micromonosporaceae bacterium]|nr:pentapeptide repeat-containing protein [Micromonosporaceae bacterium]
MADGHRSSGAGDGGGADPLERANDRIRGAAKWLIASAAAVGAALIAGSQLSSIGKLDVGLPTTVDLARLWVASAGAAIGLAGVVYAVWTAVQLLLPKLVLVDDLDAAWQGGDPKLAPVVRYFRRNRKYLQGFDSPGELITERSRLIAERAQAGGGQPQHAEGEQTAELDALIADIDARIGAVEDLAAHVALRADFEATLRRLMSAAIVVALGIVAFAWAANPPTRPVPGADLRNSRLVDAFLRDADLRNARLDNADLTRADLTGADLSGASIAGVVWRDTTCPDGTNSDTNGGSCAGHLS